MPVTVVPVKKLVKPAPAPVVAAPAPKPTPAPKPAPKGPLPNVTVTQPQAKISKEYPDGTSTETAEDVGEPVVATGPQANVGVSMGMTIPIAKFHNIKFSVSLFVPCAVDPEEINQTYEQVKGWVDERVEEINTEITSQLEGDDGTAVGGEEGAAEGDGA